MNRDDFTRQMILALSENSKTDHLNNSSEENSNPFLFVSRSYRLSAKEVFAKLCFDLPDLRSDEEVLNLAQLIENYSPFKEVDSFFWLNPVFIDNVSGFIASKPNNSHDSTITLFEATFLKFPIKMLDYNLTDLSRIITGSNVSDITWSEVIEKYVELITKSAFLDAMSYIGKESLTNDSSIMRSMIALLSNILSCMTNEISNSDSMTLRSIFVSCKDVRSEIWEKIKIDRTAVALVMDTVVHHIFIVVRNCICANPTLVNVYAEVLFDSVITRGQWQETVFEVRRESFEPSATEVSFVQYLSNIAAAVVEYVCVSKDDEHISKSHQVLIDFANFLNSNLNICKSKTSLQLFVEVCSKMCAQYCRHIQYCDNTPLLCIDESSQATIPSKIVVIDALEEILSYIYSIAQALILCSCSITTEIARVKKLKLVNDSSIAKPKKVSIGSKEKSKPKVNTSFSGIELLHNSIVDSGILKLFMHLSVISLHLQLPNNHILNYSRKGIEFLPLAIALLQQESSKFSDIKYFIDQSVIVANCNVFIAFGKLVSYFADRNNNEVVSIPRDFYGYFALYALSFAKLTCDKLESSVCSGIDGLMRDYLLFVKGELNVVYSKINMPSPSRVVVANEIGWFFGNLASSFNFCLRTDSRSSFGCLSAGIGGMAADAECLNSDLLRSLSKLYVVKSTEHTDTLTVYVTDLLKLIERIITRINNLSREIAADSEEEILTAESLQGRKLEGVVSKPDSLKTSDLNVLMRQVVQLRGYLKKVFLVLQEDVSIIASGVPTLGNSISNKMD